MAKRKRAQPLKNTTKVAPLKWADEEDARMLAWVDKSLIDCKIDFKSSVEARLNGLRSLNAIETRLSTLWGKHGPYELVNGLTGRKDLYARGSKALDNTGHGMTDNLKILLASAKEELELELSASPNAVNNTLEEKEWPLRKKITATVERKRRLRSDSLTPATLRFKSISLPPTPRSIGNKKLRTYTKHKV